MENPIGGKTRKRRVVLIRMGNCGLGRRGKHQLTLMILLDAVVDFMLSKNLELIGMPGRARSYIKTECRLHENWLVGRAVETLLNQEKHGLLPAIPSAGATSDPQDLKDRKDFFQWINHKGPRPSWAGKPMVAESVQVRKQTPAEKAQEAREIAADDAAKLANDAYVAQYGDNGAQFESRRKLLTRGRLHSLSDGAKRVPL